MGTDRVKLFNKALADQILAMDKQAFLSFLEENIDTLRQRESTQSLMVFKMKQDGCSVAEAVLRLLSGEQTFREMKTDVAQDFAAANEEIYLDYWGCYSHVFGDHPEGSISSLAYLPNQEEEIFLLLRPEHLNQMIDSLHEHADDLRVMKVRNIQRLEEWRDLCAADPSHMVAYHFDY